MRRRAQAPVGRGGHRARWGRSGGATLLRVSLSPPPLEAADLLHRASHAGAWSLPSPATVTHFPEQSVTHMGVRSR